MPKQSEQGEHGEHGRVKGQSPAKITQHLKGINFPCSKNDLIKHAKQNDADHSVITLLQNMPDRQYASMADVMKSYDEAREEAA